MRVRMTRVTWKDLVADALRQLGGKGHLSDIYQVVAENPKTQTNPTWQATIRRVVRQYGLFEPVAGERAGTYRLREPQPPQVQPVHLERDEPDLNHAAAQGMLLRLGQIYGYETYAPKADQTVREFQGARLRELVTVHDCTGIFAGPSASQIAQIDVLWFDEDDYGLYPVYAFEVEHTTRVETALNRLLKIPRRYAVDLFVVGPDHAKRKLFEQRLKQAPFRAHSHRVHFRLYTELEELHNTAVGHSCARDQFGVVERFAR